MGSKPSERSDAIPPDGMGPVPQWMPKLERYRILPGGRGPIAFHVRPTLLTRRDATLSPMSTNGAKAPETIDK